MELRYIARNVKDDYSDLGRVLNILFRLVESIVGIWSGGRRHRRNRGQRERFELYLSALGDARGKASTQTEINGMEEFLKNGGGESLYDYWSYR